MSYAGTYKGTIHTYCDSFNYTDAITFTISESGLIDLPLSSQGTLHDGNIDSSGLISGISITVNSLSLGTITIPYAASDDGSNFSGTGTSINGITSTIQATLVPVTDDGLTVSGSVLFADGSRGRQTLTGTGPVNFLSSQNAAGTGNVVVDLSNGYVSHGDTIDATIFNIQGVQLGADASTVIGLTSGTDLLYGSSGSMTVYGQGATDYIRGGTGSNTIIGGAGNEIFYGNGGTDVMRGGTAQSFMQAGPTAASSDTFYGNSGTDFVYGGAGTTTLYGGAGTEVLTGGSGTNTLVGSNQSASSLNIFNGGPGNDVFYAGVGTNLLFEGTGTDIFAGGAGTDYIYGGAGHSYVYGSTGFDIVSTGAGNQYVSAGSGYTVFNDTVANLKAGRFDQIDNFSGSKGTEFYLPAASQQATSFVAQNGGTAILTAVGSGSAEIFVSNAAAASVQAHTHFTL